MTQDKYRGSLLGGAVGDALGYQVEFSSYNTIKNLYGTHGITRYQKLNEKGQAVISDDTQMTLFTANGLLFGLTRQNTHGAAASLDSYVQYAYIDWLKTQTNKPETRPVTWIRDIKELNVRRAPGNTCLSALESILRSEDVVNDSKGCGGVMRTAPAGLLHIYNAPYSNSRYAMKLGGECARITHKHPLGYITGGFLASLIFNIVRYDKDIDADKFYSFLKTAYEDAINVYNSDREIKCTESLWKMTEYAIEVAKSKDTLDGYDIVKIGEGWTGDEALAIAICCTYNALFHSTENNKSDFEKAIITAVNHDGDSDSTGAVCGNIIGAILGEDAIPDYFLDKLELRDIITELADDLLIGCPNHEAGYTDEQIYTRWEKRYINCRAD